MRDGYTSLKMSDGSNVAEHIVIAERILKRPIGKNEVHHVNYIKKDNRNENLVICQDRNYHKLLHVRTDALAECGNANYRKCWICKQYGDPAEMINKKKRSYAGNYVHDKCDKEYYRKSYTKL